jgi:hypothetical protein
MAAIDFPNSPVNSDTFTVGARTWTWSGTIWEITGIVAAAGSIGTTELAASAVTTAKIVDAVKKYPTLTFEEKLTATMQSL